MKNLVKLLTLAVVMSALAFGCGEATDLPGDGRDDAFLAVNNGKGDSQDVSEAELRAILEVVNTYSRHRFVADVNWHWPAADHVVDYRNGDDEIRGTDDDRIFQTLQEVDDVPYVGAVAYNRLRDYVRDNDLIARHEMTFTEDIPKSINSSFPVAIRGTISKKGTIKIPVQANAGDRLRFWLRKASDKQWNPRIRLSEVGGDRLFSENPWGTSDARLPVDGESYEAGWLLESDNEDFTLELANTASIEGEFEFTMECVSGPCWHQAIGGDSEVLDGDFTGLDDEELLTQLAADHERTHEIKTYYDARFFMFSNLDNFGGFVSCVYTGMVVETEAIPHYYTMSAEHTWPQSEGAIKGEARTDLHHIYPVQGLANSIRAAYPFCEVEEVIREIGPAKLGLDEHGTRCFEPAEEHKGNAARSMFYFAASYALSMDDVEEAVLREWHRQDPVDNAERVRAEEIAKFQGSKNHFVLDSELVDRVSDF